MKFNLKRFFQFRERKPIIFYTVLVILIHIIILILTPKTGWAICEKGVGGNCWGMSIMNLF